MISNERLQNIDECCTTWPGYNSKMQNAPSSPLILLLLFGINRIIGFIGITSLGEKSLKLNTIKNLCYRINEEN